MAMMIAETYSNTCYEGHTCKRWWAGPDLLVGGSICDAADMQHLRDNFKIDAVLSVESERSDLGKGIGPYGVWLPFPDDGTPPEKVLVRNAIAFGGSVLMQKRKLYVHCQMGGSRSPAIAYAILRAIGFTSEQTLAAIRVVKPEYGEHAYHKAYLGVVEAVMAEGF